MSTSVDSEKRRLIFIKHNQIILAARVRYSSTSGSIDGLIQDLKKINAENEAKNANDSPDELIYRLFKVPNKDEAVIGRLLTVNLDLKQI